MQKILQVGTAVQTFSARDALHRTQVALLTPLAPLTATSPEIPSLTLLVMRSQCFASIWFGSGSGRG